MHSLCVGHLYGIYLLLPTLFDIFLTVTLCCTGLNELGKKIIAIYSY